VFKSAALIGFGAPGGGCFTVAMTSNRTAHTYYW